MNDAAFIQALESGALPAHEMNHAAHLRLALLFRGDPGRAREVLLKYIGKVGAQVKYNETLTWFWLRAVNAHQGHTVKELCARLSPTPTCRCAHWSPEVLWSDAARTGWVEPDLKALPF